MERLQGPINPSFFGEHLEQERNALEFSYGQFVNTESLRFDEEQESPYFSTTQSLEDKMPFLQMLQSVESPPFSPFTEPSFQTLLRLQHLKKPWERNYTPEMETQIQALELESCITHDLLEMHSPVKSETKDFQHPHSTSRIEGVSSECNQEHPNSVENSGSSPGWVRPQTSPKRNHFSKSPPPINRERRKRKRTRPTKNKDEVESQRMTHIAVERNRRRQMNDHLNSLRSLMPPSYIQRGDQASIIGGAIDFVKELEQLLQSLQAQKRMRKAENGGDSTGNSSSSSSSSAAVISLSGPFRSSPVQFRVPSAELNCIEEEKSDELTVENKSEGANVEVTVIQTHVNLKIQCPRRPGQLLKAIVALEDLRLTVLHLNITSLHTSVLYSFNLKIEDDCKLGSADEIGAAVRQIFNFINGN